VLDQKIGGANERPWFVIGSSGSFLGYNCRCRNFGHVHHQLQNSAGLPLPDSLPAQFVGYLADGKPVASGEPVRRQTVSNAPAAGAAQPASTNQPGSK